jgi:hypothetical protein
VASEWSIRIIFVLLLALSVSIKARGQSHHRLQRLVMATKDGAALFAQSDVMRTLEVGTKSAKAQITDKAKATEMLEDDPGSTSAQTRDSR